MTKQVNGGFHKTHREQNEVHGASDEYPLQNGADFYIMHLSEFGEGL